ncbi:DUF4259 domain-containing protein [Streptomyces sp. NPDC004787]|uniref:DUF4259 domain-containing protein n=1 Tax=Streptomyces sp. NPDC004787 TaxID=3154291 RepID=UPI0033ACDE86
MSTWGFGFFENDRAVNFCRFLDGAEPHERFAIIHGTLLNAGDRSVDYIEAEDGEEVIAASALVASQLPDGTLPDFHFAPGEPLPSLGPLRALAAQALVKVLGEDSELPELYAGTDNEEPWRILIGQLIDKLTA